MRQWQGEALGTHWSVDVDGEELRPEAVAAIEAWLLDFERRFSRFLPDSEVNAFRSAKPGRHSVSNTLAELLTTANILRQLTAGRFDPTVAELLEKAGYDATYSLTPQVDTQTFIPAKWRLVDGELELDGPVAFDVGGIGKGYAIDAVAALLKTHGHQHFIVDAGGDMFGTQKADGGAWRVAVAQPGEPETAVGVVELHNCALAVSDTFRRRWGNWHHLVDVQTKAVVPDRVGAAAMAPTAFAADAMTSALFFADAAAYEEAAAVFHASYLVFYEDGAVLKSTDWRGELFTR